MASLYEPTRLVGLFRKEAKLGHVYMDGKLAGYFLPSVRFGTPLGNVRLAPR